MTAPVKLALATSLLLAALGAPAAAQSQSVIQSRDSDGTLWFQSIPAIVSAGSAQLASYDRGVLAPPDLVAGIHASWIEWTPDRAFVAHMEETTTLSSLEIFRDYPTNTVPFDALDGVATMNSGFGLMFNGAGGLTGVRPHGGALIWDDLGLFAVADAGIVAVEEILDSTGNMITDVRGVVFLTSGTFDEDTAPTTVDPHTRGCAIVYTPSRVHLVDLDINLTTITYSTVDLLDPSAAQIPGTRGACVVQSGWDFGSFPPAAPLGAAFLWNGSSVFAIEKTSGYTINEVFDTTGASIDTSWGVMKIAGQVPSTTSYRYAAMVWQEGQAWVVTADPTLIVQEATEAPGTSSDPSLVSEVYVNPGPPSALVERQASSLYEILARWRDTSSSNTRRGLVIGCDQR